MTKSLNQAFIKAYSKDNASVNRQAAPEGTQIDSPDLIMRFDTATVAIPAPHAPRHSANGGHQTSVPQRRDQPPQASPVGELRNYDQGHTVPQAPKLPSGAQRIRHAEVVYSQPAHNPQTHQDTSSRQNATAPDATSYATDEESIRYSIANQMLQAGGWDNLQLDTFAGADMQAKYSTPANHVVRTSQPAETKPARTPHVLEQRLGTEPQYSVAPEAAVKQATRPAPETMPRIESPALQTSVLPRQGAEGKPAQAAIAQPASRTTESQDTDATPEQGDIFRLDRPSYQAQDASPEERVDSGAGEESSHEGSRTSVDIPVATQTKHKSLHPDHAVVHTNTSHRTPGKISRNDSPVVRSDINKEAAEVEQRLRDAKNRVFNPVWEVDNLHWPDICFDLLSQSGEQMDAVAENLLNACEEGLQIMAVTSPKGGEGRTTIACCLAILAGSRGLRVAIVDGDLESPSLSHQTNLDVDQDWRTAIEHQLPLEEVCIHSIEDQVTVVPLVKPVSHQELSPDDDRIATMLQELSDSFDLVIVDMGHMNSPRSLVATMGEYGVLSAVVAVVDRRDTSAEQIDTCLRRVRQAGIVSIGLVENFTS